MHSTRRCDRSLATGEVGVLMNALCLTMSVTLSDRHRQAGHVSGSD